MVKRLESHARDSRQLRQPMKIQWTPRAAERTACCIKPKCLPMSIAKDVITAATQTYVVVPDGKLQFHAMRVRITPLAFEVLHFTPQTTTQAGDILGRLLYITRFQLRKPQIIKPPAAVKISLRSCTSCGQISTGGYHKPEQMPLRLISVSRWKMVDVSKVCSKCYSIHRKYTVILHVWSPDKSVLTDHGIEGVDWDVYYRSDAPKSLRDTLEVIAASMHVDLVWMDTLCVIQDDMNDVNQHVG